MILGRLLQAIPLPQVSPYTHPGRGVMSASPAVADLVQPGVISTSDPARLDAALATLELTVRRRLDGLLQGNHLGLVPGSGHRAGGRRAVQPR